MPASHKKATRIQSLTIPKDESKPDVTKYVRGLALFGKAMIMLLREIVGTDAK